jgi:mRNA-degrading endonuclease RelE of RelBE toxin-antitoxin system
MAFRITMTDLAIEHLAAMRAFEERRVIEAIDKHLAFEPNVPTRNRKCLRGASPPFNHVPPIWELKVGDMRVYYDVEAGNDAVYVRAVLKKRSHLTTEDVFHEEADN